MRSPMGAATTTPSVDHQTAGLPRPWGSHPAAGRRTPHLRLASQITPTASQRAKGSPEAPIVARIRVRVAILTAYGKWNLLPTTTAKGPSMDPTTPKAMWT